MNTDYLSTNVSALAERWWVLEVRGVAAILFGILAIVAPGTSLLALVILWGAYALVDGVSNLMLAVRRSGAGQSWGWLLFEGIVSLAAGVFTFAWPGMTGLVLLMVIAIWAVLTGFAKIATAIRLRSQISGEWMLGASGALAILFGVFLFLSPGAGALALVWVIGGYAIVIGALLIGLGLRLHRWGRAPASPV